MQEQRKILGNINCQIFDLRLFFWLQHDLLTSTLIARDPRLRENQSSQCVAYQLDSHILCHRLGSHTSENKNETFEG